MQPVHNASSVIVVTVCVGVGRGTTWCQFTNWVHGWNRRRPRSPTGELSTFIATDIITRSGNYRSRTATDKNARGLWTAGSPTHLDVYVTISS